MYSGSSAAFDAAIKKREQFVCSKIRLTLKNGTVYDLSDNDFLGRSLEIEKSAFPNSVFELGGIGSKTISFTLNNHDKEWDNVNFKDAKAEAWSGLYIDGVPEYIPLGVFWIDSAGKPYDTVDITGCDSIMKLDKSYSSSTLSYPASIKQILEEIASKCGVNLTSSDIFNQGIIVNASPDKTQYTFRDVLSFVATIAGGFARISRNNQLEIVQINKPDSNFYTIGQSYRLSCKTDYTISITGLAYYGNLQNKLYGSDTYPLILDNNPLIDNMSDSDQENVLSGLYSLYNGFTYTPFECEFIGDPRVDEGDYVFLTDTRDGNIGTYIFKYTFTNGGTQQIEAPTCDELDKNFLDSNKKKDSDTASKIDHAYNNSGSSGGSSGSSVTEYIEHDGKPWYEETERQGDNQRNNINGGQYTVKLLLQDLKGVSLNTSTNPPYYIVFYPLRSTTGGYVVDDESEIIFGNFPSSNVYSVPGPSTNRSITLTRGITYGIKVYTEKEWEILKNGYNGYSLANGSYLPSNYAYDVKYWPVFHTISPNVIDYTSYQETTIITVNTAVNRVVDSYVRATEAQIASALYTLFTRIFRTNTELYDAFTEHYNSPEAVYDFLMGFRKTNIGKVLEVEGNGFMNPITVEGTAEASITNTNVTSGYYTMTLTVSNSEDFLLFRIQIKYSNSTGKTDRYFIIPFKGIKNSTNNSFTLSGSELVEFDSSDTSDNYVAMSITSVTFAFDSDNTINMEMIIPEEAAGSNYFYKFIGTIKATFDIANQTGTGTYSENSGSNSSPEEPDPKPEPEPEEPKPEEPEKKGFEYPFSEQKEFYVDYYPQEKDEYDNNLANMHIYGHINSTQAYINYCFTDYTDWSSQTAEYTIDLAGISSDSTIHFSYNPIKSDNSLITQNLNSITFTFDIENNKITIMNEFTETDNVNLNYTLSQQIIF